MIIMAIEKKKNYYHDVKTKTIYVTIPKKKKSYKKFKLLGYMILNQD